MKKLTALVLAILMVLSLAACGGTPEAPAAEEPAQAPAQEAAPAEGDASGEPGVAQGGAGGASGSTEMTYLPAVAPDENVALADGTSATFYYPKFYNYFDAAAKNQLGYMLWNDYLFMMDWSLNDPSECDFTGAQITYDHIIGQAAEEYTWADDYSSIEIKLRDGITFQKKDGEYDIFGGRAFTAQDAAYSFERLLGLNGVEKVTCETDWTTQLYMVAGVEVINDLTFRVDFNTKSENALNDFIVECTTGVALTGPEWDALTEEQKADWHYANGIGAYILTNYVADNYMQFIANPNYYGVDERTGDPLPHIANVKLVYIADGDQILTQFIAGELDWFGGQKSGLLNDSQIAQLKATMAEGSYTEYFYPSGSPSGIGLKTNIAPWNDIRVRQALQHAINCEEIWTRYFGETSEYKLAGLWATETGAWADTAVNLSAELAAEYTYDPALAQQLLKEAGAEGLTFDIVCDPLTDMDLYVLVQSYLAAVGVTMNIVPVPEVMEHNAIVKDETDPRAFNAFAGNFSKANDVYGMTVTGGFGSGYFHNDEAGQKYDALYEKLTAAEDMTSATEIAQEMDEIWLGQHWCITFGGAPMCSEFMSSRISGFTGENIFNNNSMHTIFARLYAAD